MNFNIYHLQTWRISVTFKNIHKLKILNNFKKCSHKKELDTVFSKHHMNFQPGKHRFFHEHQMVWSRRNIYNTKGEIHFKTISNF